MDIDIIEAPIDFGASRHGSDMGPSSIRLAGLPQRIKDIGHTIKSYGDATSGAFSPADCAALGDPKAKYLVPIQKACTALAQKVYESAKCGVFPLTLGGDHSIVLGTLAGVSRAVREAGGTLGVLYVDAHGDFNTTETTPTGNIHGQCLAASAGLGLPSLTNLFEPKVKVNPENICFVGSRDLDAGEKLLMKQSGVTVFSMSDIERQGFFNVTKKVVVFFRSRVTHVHISFDMDALDPMFAPGTGVPVSAGLTNREALLLMEEMAATHMVSSADLVEVNPVLDVRNTTAELAVDLIARLLGEKLY